MACPTSAVAFQSSASVFARKVEQECKIRAFIPVRKFGVESFAVKMLAIPAYQSAADAGVESAPHHDRASTAISSASLQSAQSGFFTRISRPRGSVQVTISRARARQ